MKLLSSFLPLGLLSLLLSLATPSLSQEADRILHHGKIVTVDKSFSIQEALAIKGNRILRVGTNPEVLKSQGQNTEMIDLAGKTVLPGLIDSHVHPSDACMTEFDHPIPEMETIQNVLDYIQSRATILPSGQWIHVQQIFITRLKEQRYPTREELDQVAPKHPVLFSTGPDASLNSLALKLSGIDRNFRVTDGGPGYIEKDLATGEPTGILRSCTRYVKVEASGKKPTESDRVQRLLELFNDYNSVGITSIGDRDASVQDIERYKRILANGDLRLRVSISEHIDTIGPMEKIQANIRRVAEDPLRQGDTRLRIIGIKTYLDGGMLTGQRLHAGALGRERDLFDHRSQLSWRAFHSQGATIAHGSDHDRISICNSQRTRSVTARSMRCSMPMRRSTKMPDTRHTALHHSFEFHESRSRGEAVQAGRRG